MRLNALSVSALGSWASLAFQLIAGVTLARSLAPSEFGVFILGAAAAALIFGLFDLRFEDGLTQLLVREKHLGRSERTRGALRYALVVDVLSGFLIFGVAAVVMILIPGSVIHADAAYSATIVALAYLVGIADGSFNAIFFSNQAFGRIAVSQVVGSGSRAVAYLALPLESSSDAAWATVVAQVVSTGFLLCLVYGSRLIPPDAGPLLTASEKRSLLRFSLHTSLAAAVAAVKATAAPIVLGTLGTPREVAAARVASSPPQILVALTGPLRTVMFPRMSQAWAARDRVAATEVIRGYIAYATGAVLVVGLPMGLAMSALLAMVYGSAYDNYGNVAIVFLVAASGEAIAGWQKVAPAALDRPALRTVILTAESGTLLLALVLLVPRFGPMGAAISAVLAAVVSLGVGAWRLGPALRPDRWAVPPDQALRGSPNS